MIKDLLEFIYKKKGLLFKPVEQEGKKELLDYFEKIKVPKLPLEYFKLLSLTDGISFSGIELYGFQSHDREIKSYTFPSLKEVNFQYRTMSWSKKLLILGHFSEEMIAFNYELEQFELRDRFDLSLSYAAKDLEEFLREILIIQIEEIK